MQAWRQGLRAGSKQRPAGSWGMAGSRRQAERRHALTQGPADLTSDPWPRQPATGSTCHHACPAPVQQARPGPHRALQQRRGHTMLGKSGEKRLANWCSRQARRQPLHAAPRSSWCSSPISSCIARVHSPAAGLPCSTATATEGCGQGARWLPSAGQDVQMGACPAAGAAGMRTFAAATTRQMVPSRGRRMSGTAAEGKLLTLQSTAGMAGSTVRGTAGLRCAAGNGQCAGPAHLRSTSAAMRSNRRRCGGHGSGS